VAIPSDCSGKKLVLDCVAVCDKDTNRPGWSGTAHFTLEGDAGRLAARPRKLMTLIYHFSINLVNKKVELSAKTRACVY